MGREQQPYATRKGYTKKDRSENLGPLCSERVSEGRIGKKQQSWTLAKAVGKIKGGRVSFGTENKGR